MNTYYVFNESKITLAEQLLPQRQGEGFFDFKLHQKMVRQTTLPLSNTQSETLTDYRPVLILETDFADEDAAIRAAAETEAEFFSTDSATVLEYLATFDSQT